MLIAIRQLAAADFIALIRWLGDDLIEVSGADPSLRQPHTMRVPAAWRENDASVTLALHDARRLLPLAVLLQLPTMPAAAALVHGPENLSGRRGVSLLLAWNDVAQIAAHVRDDPRFLQLLLVGPGPGADGGVPDDVARLRAIMAHVPQGVIFADSLRAEAVVNPAAAGWLNIPAGIVTGEVIARAMDSLCARVRNSEFVRREANRITADPDARIEDWIWELDDGSSSTLRVMSVPIDAEAGRGRLWTFDDISHERAMLRELAQHRAMEEKLRHVQKLEIVGRLAASVAHDFNNLLTIIGGSVEMLEDAQLDAERRVDLASIGNATDRARRLTRQLLTFTRQQVEQSVSFRLDERLRETAPLLRKVIAPHCTLALQLQSGAAEVFADPNQVELALLNLLANARDAMPAGGVITLRSAVEQLHGERMFGSPNPLSGVHVAISVQDTGTGFDEQTRAHMFEPFFTTKPSGQGTGLGLATALSIAERAGGGVRCSSTVGTGSIFSMLLPCVNPYTTAPGSASASTPRAALRQFVLLVDDDEGPRETLRRLLVHDGFDVEVADSAAQALRVLQESGSSVSALVTDYMMPHMSGRELIQRMRLQWPDLPAVVISGFSADADMSDFLRRMRAGFLAKPFTGRQLAEAIRQQLALISTGRSQAD